MTPSTDDQNADRVLVFAVHPDDETLGAGGLIQKALKAGSRIRVIVVTDGDNNPWPQRYVERRWKILPMDRERWGKRRREEAVAALALLGVAKEDIEFWGLPDQGLTHALTHRHTEIVARIVQEVQSWQPSCIVAPALQDTHPDHSAFGLLVDLAIRRLDIEMPAPQVLHYLIHGQTLYAPMLSVELNDAELQLKRDATLSHKTQVALCKRRFLNYSTSREHYYSAPAPDAYQLQHPVRAAVSAPPLLSVHIQTNAWTRRLGRPVLSIMDGDIAYRIDLTKRGQVAVEDHADGKTVSQAFLVENGDNLELSLPLSLFESVDRLYFKVERRGAFFDPAGWRSLALSTEKTEAPIIGLMPCYDVEDFCEQVILKTVREVDHLIVIDDGCKDGTTQITRRLAVQLPGRISLIRFERNQGKGVGLMAGFVHALNHFDFETLITIDADGQHPPGRIHALVEKIYEGAEMVIGERQVTEMPGRSRIGNILATHAIRWLHPHAPSDTQSGMRAFSRALVEEIARKISGSRYETEFQILLLALGKGKRIATAEIPTIYIDNNRSSKFRPVLDTLRIARTMFRSH